MTVAQDPAADRWERCQAMEDLAIRGDAEAVAVIRAQFDDPKAKVGRCAARALSSITDPKAAPALERLLAERDATVVTSAAEALAWSGDRGSIRPLARLLDRRQREVVLAGAAALGKLGFRAAVRPLERLALRGLTSTGADRGTRVVRRQAVVALGQIRAPAAQTTLRRVLRSDPANARAAGRALVRIFEDDVTRLLPMLDDGRNIALAYALVDRGQKGTEDALAAALLRHGGLRLAEYYLNCGNDRLEGAAHRWASAHGYTVTTQPGMPGDEWGSGVD